MKGGAVEVGSGEQAVIAGRVRVLAMCPAGAEGLGCALEEILRPAQNLELRRLNLEDEESPKLAEIIAKSQPGLLLLCFSEDSHGRYDTIFQAIANSQRELSILVILQSAAPEELQRFIALGAADFCLAPLRVEDLLPRILRWSRVDCATHSLARELGERLGLQQMIGHSRAFVEATRRIPKLARCDASVLITGETGTGKEMCARAIHQLGPRAHHPFVPVNCGAIPSELVENELFGHDAGAFTGATSAVRGLINDAEGGTLFLDEIDSLPLSTQVKFLRFLQDQEYRPLGARKTLQADIRLIAAANTDLESLVQTGRFRADLFFRLNILPLKLPALRERCEDIPLLARHFLVKCAGECGAPVKELSRTALEKLMAYAWPGNIRELENIMERAVVLSEQSMITGEDICLPGNAPAPEVDSFKALKAHAIAEFETAYVRRLLAANNGNISQAARAARKNRRAFWQLMRKHAIVPAGPVAVR